MVSPRWRKLGRDLRTQKGRVLLLIVAVAVSLAGIGMVLGAYAILMRELPRNYAGTEPASATLDLGADVPRSLVDAVRARPGIAEAEARGVVIARAKVGEDWRRLVLHVIDDFHDLRLNLFRPVSGAWPPPDGTMLIERMAVSTLEARQGDRLIVKTPHGPARPVEVAGIVHDPGLAQAWQEHAGYGYITRTTLGRLGEPAVLDELRIRVSERPLDAGAIEATARDLAAWLGTRGYTVHEIRVPPPGMHPHQFQITLVLLVQLAFGVMLLVLSAILIASTLDAMLARQTREIGVMKTVGARTAQIAGIYAAFVALLGTAATALAIPAGSALARAFAGAVGANMNCTLASQAIPWWVFLAEALAGTVVPLAVAAAPIWRTTRLTVRQAIEQCGINPVTASRQRLARLARRPWISREWVLAVQNTLRQRTRLLPTVALLVVGGAMFLTAVNVYRSWERNIARAIETRRYDVEVYFSEPQPRSLVDHVRNIPGVRRVEAWGYSQTTAARPGEVDLTHTYPDRAHGSAWILGAPADTELVQVRVRSGRWLVPGDTDAAVLTQYGTTLFPGTRVGDAVWLSVNGVPTRWRVVGIADESGAVPAAYVTDKAFARVGATGAGARLFRIANAAESADAHSTTVRRIDDELVRAGASVQTVMAVPLMRTILDDHMAILTGALVILAVLMAAVGSLGLASTLSISVLQRTRELGVMKAIGATPGLVARMIVGEGLLVGAVSWVLALVFAAPLTLWLGGVLGTAGAFGAPLSVLVSPSGALAWLGVTSVVSVAASLIPARRASRLTVREALVQS
jgi:putative ABC transport system permease protein